MAQLAESPDATQLQRRARRRLVGAIALVILIVIVLPIVLDKEPGPIGQDLVIQIPNQEAGRFNTRVLPSAAPGASAPPASSADAVIQDVAKAEPPTPPSKAASGVGPAARPEVSPAKAEQTVVSTEASVPTVPEPDAKKVAPAPAKDQPRAAKDDSDAVRAKALLEGNDAWVVRLGAFSNETNVKQLRQKLSAADVKSYTETAKGPKGDQTRVRAGPFDSRLEAERAQEKLKAAGISPGTVGPR